MVHSEHESHGWSGRRARGSINSRTKVLSGLAGSKRLTAAIASTALIVGMTGGPAFADSLTSSPASPVNTTVGSSAAVTFALNATTDTGDGNGSDKCNAKTGNGNGTTLSFTFTQASGGTASATPPTHIFQGCPDPFVVQFSATLAGDYTVHPVLTGGTPQVYTVSAFTLHVAVQPPTAAPTTLTLANASAAYDAASVDLVSTLTSGLAGVASKSVTFSVNGTNVGSASTNSSGVATYTYPLDRTKPATSYTTSASFSGDSSFQTSTADPRTLTVTKASQSITFDAPADTTYGVTPFAVAATASSGLAVNFPSSTTAICTVAGSTITILSAGVCSLTAAQAGDSNWFAATSVSRSFNVAQATQSVSLSLSRYSATFHDGLSTTITANATSALAVALGVSGPCTLLATSLQASGAGSCVVTGDQAGNVNYSAAPQASQTLAVGKADQSIAFGALAPMTYGDPDFALSATATSDLGVAFTAAPSSVCTLSGSRLSIAAAGDCTVTATQPGDANWNSAPSIAHTFTVNKANQTITFDPLSSKTFKDDPFDVSATSTSLLQVAFDASGQCTFAGGKVTITGAGQCSVAATQVGDTNFQAATPVVQTFLIAESPQTIILPFLAPKTWPITDPITVGATSDSGLPVALTAGPNDVCSAIGDVITVVGAGVCEVTANQGGNSNYLAADPQTGSFEISKGTQSITFTHLDDTTYGVTQPALDATADSGLAVTFASTTPDVCDVAGSALTIKTGGTCTVTASQGGGHDWNAAADVSQSFSVAKAPQVISLSIDPTTATFGDGPATVTASSNSGLAPVLTVTGRCTLAGTSLAFSAGLCTVKATQLGDGRFMAADEVVETLDVLKAAQVISFESPADVTYGADPFQLTATASSNLDVAYLASPADVCTVLGADVTLHEAGQCTVKAQQLGDPDWNPAGDVTHVFSVKPAKQTITFAALEGKTFGNAPFDVSATTTSGLPAAFAASGQCTIADHTVTITGAGSCTVTATQDGDRNYLGAVAVTRTFTVDRAKQTITFAALIDRTYLDSDFPLTATSDSGLTVAFASTTTPVCTVAGTTVSILAAGTCTIEASQGGTENYLRAPEVARSFTVAKHAQDITFAPPPSIIYGDDPLALEATAASLLAVSFSVATGDVCTLSAETLTFLNTGNCVVTAKQSGDNNWFAAAPEVWTITVQQKGQTISMAITPSAATYEDGPATVTATATSDLPVTLGVSGPCTLGTPTGSTTPLAIGGAGNCIVTGDQLGNRNYSPATQALQTLAIAKKNQSITFGTLVARTYGDAQFVLGGTASSHLGVVYEATPGAVCTVSGSTLTIQGAGNCTVTAKQAGDDNYNSADDVPQTFTVGRAVQSITFATLLDKTYGGAAVTLSATASSGGPVTFSATGTCSVSGTILTLIHAGSCTVTAMQVGTTNYLPAPEVARSFKIAQASQHITFEQPADMTYGDPAFLVSPNSDSDLPVETETTTPLICSVSTGTVTLLAGGTCTLKASQAGNDDYLVAPVISRSFNVAKATLTVTAPSASRLLHAANPLLNPTYNGWVNNDSAEKVGVLISPATCTTTAVPNSPVGPYPVTCKGASSDKYAFTYVDGTLTVGYKYSALLQPINLDGRSAFKSGSTIPVKFQVLDALDVVQDAGALRATLRVVKTSASTATAVNEDVLTTVADAGATFRWDTSGRQYIYNLSTKTWSMTEGTYRLDVVDASGTVLTSATIQVKK